MESDGDSIKVFIRVRPLVTETTDVDLGTCLEVDKDRKAVVMRSKSDPKLFTFDEVADKSVTQVTRCSAFSVVLAALSFPYC